MIDRHADLFLLGLFVTSAELGAYSEAALFARIFLLVPLALRPVMHRHFAGLVSTGDIHEFSRSLAALRGYLFYIHALQALFLTTYFDDTIHLVLGFYGSEKVSYDLFTLMLPGFLFYAAAILVITIQVTILIPQCNFHISHMQTPSWPRESLKPSPFWK